MRYLKDLYRPGKALPGIFGASPPHRAAQPPFALFLGDGPMRDAGDPYRAPDLQKPVERVSARTRTPKLHPSKTPLTRQQQSPPGFTLLCPLAAHGVGRRRRSCPFPFSRRVRSHLGWGSSTFTTRQNPPDVLWA